MHQIQSCMNMKLEVNFLRDVSIHGDVARDMHDKVSVMAIWVCPFHCWCLQMSHVCSAQSLAGRNVPSLDFSVPRGGKRKSWVTVTAAESHLVVAEQLHFFFFFSVASLRNLSADPKLQLFVHLNLVQESQRSFIVERCRKPNPRALNLTMCAVFVFVSVSLFLFYQA